MRGTDLVHAYPLVFSVFYLGSDCLHLHSHLLWPLDALWVFTARCCGPGSWLPVGGSAFLAWLRVSSQSILARLSGSPYAIGRGK